MYKPNFCADCGARVARTRWRLWTSRRFCSACERRFRRARLPSALALCLVLLGAGYATGRLTRPASPPLTLKTTAPASPLLALAPPAPPPQAGAANAKSEGPQTGADSRYGPDGSSQERPTDPGETVSMCGARTKKGTPCSRRVRGTGRCWQHRGRSAMLPPGRLVVPG